MTRSAENQGFRPTEEGVGDTWGWLQDPCEGLIYAVMKREGCSRRKALRKLQVDIPEKVELREVPGGKAFRFNCTIWRRIEDGEVKPWLDEQRPVTARRIGDDQGLLPKGRRGSVALPLETEVIPVDESEYEYLGDQQREEAKEEVSKTSATLGEGGEPMKRAAVPPS